MSPSDEHLAGFWRRFAALLIDILLLALIAVLLPIPGYGMALFDSEQTDSINGPVDFLISYVLPAIATVWFWLRYQATPGKLALRAYVVDATTGSPITMWQALIRYVGYFVSLLPLGLGYIWVVFDERKQSWHDKMANTLVVVR